MNEAVTERECTECKRLRGLCADALDMVKGSIDRNASLTIDIVDAHNEIRALKDKNDLLEFKVRACLEVLEGSKKEETP